MEFTEKVNLEICQKLKDMTFIQYKELSESTISKKNDDWKTDIIGEYTKLNNFLKEILSSKNNHVVKYDFVKGKTFGRLQSQNPSLQRIYKPFRGILCDGITYDLDMINAHPNILINYCKKNSIPCPALTDYIENREECLNEIMEEFDISRDYAKTQYLTCINKQTLTTKINGKKVKSKKFNKFSLECVEIIKSLYEKYKVEYKDYLKSETEEWNYKGKLINLLLCKTENEYLGKAKELLKKKNIEVCTLMFDGCMIYINESYKIETIIKELDTLFKKYNIKWSLKNHNTDLLERINEMVIIKVDTFLGDNIVEVSNHILGGILKNKIYNDIDTTYLYTKDIIIQSNIQSKLYNIVSDNDYYFVEHHNGDKRREVVKASKVYTHIEHIAKTLMMKAPEDKDFLNEVWKYTQFKLFFKNGYYDFNYEENGKKTCKFIEGTHNKTFIKINKNYTTKRNEKKRKILYDKILYPVFSIDDVEKDQEQVKLLEYFLYRMSRVLAGNIEDKVWILLQGLRNCGKGVLSDLLKNAFEGYIKTTNIGNFITKKLNTDTAKTLSWIIDYQFVRLAITQESVSSLSLKEKENIDGNMIKKFCSGGDEMEARKNHQDEYTFKIQSALMICCNDCPDIQPSDAMEFCNEFQMKSKFVDKEKLKDPSNLNTFKYYEKDPIIKSELLNDPEILMEFINIIIEAYNTPKEYPQSIKKDLEENEDEDDYTKLFNIFTITDKTTGKDRDFITNEDLKEILKSNKIPFTIKKCKMLLKTKGVLEDRKDGERGITGIKVKENEPDKEEPKKIKILTKSDLDV